MKLIILIIMFSLVSQAQNLRFYNEINRSDTITVGVKCLNYPESGLEFDVFLDELFEGLKFKDDSWDELQFALNISLFNKTYGYRGDTYEEISNKIIEHTNQWLKKHYSKL